MSEAYNGSCHDFRILKEEFNPEKGKWFDGFELLLDLGFIGIKKLFGGAIKIPNKKRSKIELTKGEKEYNKSISTIRIKVEHSIGGLKRYRVLSDRLRMRNMIRYNQVAGICAGLWNFILSV